MFLLLTVAPCFFVLFFAVIPTANRGSPRVSFVCKKSCRSVSDTHPYGFIVVAAAFTPLRVAVFVRPLVHPTAYPCAPYAELNKLFKGKKCLAVLNLDWKNELYMDITIQLTL
ncbi:MAG: hypothetical protein J3Q66DRAFT_333855 [Benniella sp.]|nr:MAG: hypothetical protein J3Q66DRAFT_333855 [Benniella sp.]